MASRSLREGLASVVIEKLSVACFTKEKSILGVANAPDQPFASRFQTFSFEATALAQVSILVGRLKGLGLVWVGVLEDGEAVGL